MRNSDNRWRSMVQSVLSESDRLQLIHETHSYLRSTDAHSQPENQIFNDPRVTKFQPMQCWITVTYDE